MIITTAAATCLALTVYFEARGEDIDAQRMVAEVVMQRVETDGFPKDVCSVVWQDGQFSWTQDSKSDDPKDVRAWLTAQIVANEVLLYGREFNTGATYYHEQSIHPHWASQMQVVGLYGDHIFYRKKTGDEK